jgi:hypothetical protein
MEILLKLMSMPNVCDGLPHVILIQAINISVGKRNEVAHLQYAAHLQANPSDPLSNAHAALCSLILDELLITESSLNFFLAIRSSIRKDCTEMLLWLKDLSEPVRPCPRFRLAFY